MADRKHPPHLEIGDYAYAENREMKEIHIPEGTVRIGKHAFYNCRALETVYLPHGGIEIEDGSFKNCHNVSHIFLQHGGGDCTCLKDILYDMNQEITVTVSYGEDDMAVLLFPHYEYEYIANEPARIFSEVGYGAGYLYQQCFYNARIDYPRYDSLWNRACVSEDISVLARILSYRLRFPYGLTPEAAHSYRAYWEEHTEKLLTWYMTEHDMDSLRHFLEKTEKRTELLSLAKNIASFLGQPELISFLLDFENRLGGTHSASERFQL